MGWEAGLWVGAAHYFGDLNTKYNLEKMGFQAFYNDNNLPKEIASNSCDALKIDVVKSQYKGLELEDLSSSEKKKFNINYGVKITNKFFI